MMYLELRNNSFLANLSSDIFLLNSFFFQVKGDETQVLQSVLECDTEREKLLEEEKTLLALTGCGR